MEFRRVLFRSVSDILDDLRPKLDVRTLRYHAERCAQSVERNALAERTCEASLGSEGRIGHGQSCTKVTFVSINRSKWFHILERRGIEATYASHRDSWSRNRWDTHGEPSAKGPQRRDHIDNLRRPGRPTRVSA